MGHTGVTGLWCIYEDRSCWSKEVGAIDDEPVWAYLLTGSDSGVCIFEEIVTLTVVEATPDCRGGLGAWSM